MHEPRAGMTARWARFARGWIAAIGSLFVAACSHASAGGSLPTTAGIAFSGATRVLLGGKTLSLTRTSTAVVLSRLHFHGMFSLLRDAPLGASAPAEAGMLHGGTTGLQLGRAISAVPARTADADLWMWFGRAFGASSSRFTGIAGLRPSRSLSELPARTA